MSNAADYKQQKEDFVSNLTGGSVSEIALVTATVQSALVLWSILQSRHSFFQPYSVLGLTIDYLLNVAGFLLATTLYSGALTVLNILLLAPVLLVLALPSSSAPRKKKPKPSSSAQSKPNASSAQADVLPLKPFLTSYRGTMLIATCIAILAVDFRIFPRRFAKVETWGTSLMDIGVGAFVFASGVAAARPVLKERATGRSLSLGKRLLYSMRHSAALFVLGVVRLISVKELKYAEHVTEYGVHWNFFFTLGLLPPFVALFQSALKFVPSYATLAIIVSGAYELCLENTDLKAYILTAPRTDLISMNREGICGFLGYLAIFLAGQDLGMFILPRRITRSNVTAGMQRNTLIMTMAVWALIWCGLYSVATSNTFGFGLNVSRRLVNLPYVLWVAAFNSTQILGFCIIDTIFFPAFYNASDAKSEKEAYETATSPVLRAFNRNGLALFLLANLLTGLINMTVPTLDVTQSVAMAILMAYAATITAVAVALDAFNISIHL